MGLCTGQTSVDVFEAPIAVQSYAVLSRIDAIAQECQVSLLETTRLVQYFRDLRHYPTYNRVRALFYPHGVVSTVLEVSRLPPASRTTAAQVLVIQPARSGTSKWGKWLKPDSVTLLRDT